MFPLIMIPNLNVGGSLGRTKLGWVMIPKKLLRGVSSVVVRVFLFRLNLLISRRQEFAKDIVFGRGSGVKNFVAVIGLMTLGRPLLLISLSIIGRRRDWLVMFILVKLLVLLSRLTRTWSLSGLRTVLMKKTRNTLKIRLTLSKSRGR